MIYFDDEYFIDTKYKINYNNLTTSASKFESYLHNVSNVYISTTNNVEVLLVYAEDNFYTSNVFFCKEIGENIYKVIINNPEGTITE